MDSTEPLAPEQTLAPASMPSLSAFASAPLPVSLTGASWLSLAALASAYEVAKREALVARPKRTTALPGLSELRALVASADTLPDALRGLQTALGASAGAIERVSDAYRMAGGSAHVAHGATLSRVIADQRPAPLAVMVGTAMALVLFTLASAEIEGDVVAINGDTESEINTLLIALMFAKLREPHRPGPEHRRA